MATSLWPTVGCPKDLVAVAVLDGLGAVHHLFHARQSVQQVVVAGPIAPLAEEVTVERAALVGVAHLGLVIAVAFQHYLRPIVDELVVAPPSTFVSRCPVEL